MLKLITEFKLELSEVVIGCFVGVAHLLRPYGLVLKRESNLKTKTKHYTPRTQRGHFELQEKHCVDKVLI
jgi:hypothetical protein